jgi:hypothetical protein
MTTLSIELPDNLFQKLHTQGISDQNLEQLFIRFLQSYLKDNNKGTKWSEIEEYPSKFNRYIYPTVAIPTTSLDGLIGIIPNLKGDAFADTEALYDEV